MPQIEGDTRLDKVEHILASGVGILDFAVEDESSYYTWVGSEEEQWKVEDVGSVENAEEDRYIIHPEGKYFTCDVISNEREGMSVHCWCE